MTTVLLTGLPRSGITLACSLLNHLPNTIALAGPAAAGPVKAFLPRLRKDVLDQHAVPAEGIPCQDPAPRKPLARNFRLYIRSPLPFADTGAELPHAVRLYGLVRSPLHLLASWQAMGASPAEASMTGYLDSRQQRKLAAMPDRLDRQVAMIGWFLRDLVSLPRKRVLRYEDLITNPVATLAAMQPINGLIRLALPPPPARATLARPDMAELARRLEPIAPLAERFYPRFRHTLREVRDGSPIVLHSPGLEGKGRKKRVDFLIAGVQKGGTTALARMLAKHPSIRLANRKEVHFFDDDSQDWTHPDYEVFHCWFRPVTPDASVWGEATPGYLFLPEALRRIRRYNPATRFVITLRHPAFRAHSQWRMQTARGLEPLDFAAAVSPAGRARRQLGEQQARTFSYVERGLYDRQLRQLFALFPRENVHILRTDELWRDSAACLAQICDFLGIEPMAGAGPSEYLVPLDTRHMGSIGAQERRYLDRLFRGSIEQTQALTGLDLSDWLDPAYEEPMPAM